MKKRWRIAGETLFLAAALLFAGCGIAMENASEKCRAAADYVTIHHAEDGVAYGLKEILHVI